MGSKQAGTGRRSARSAPSSAGRRTGLGSKPGGSRVISRPQGPISPEERYRLIAEAAYFRALRRGFSSGGEVQDWLEAEADVDARLQSG